jgi:hypothetical protein
MTTQNAQHTPGPWRVADGGVTHWYIYRDKDEIATTRHEFPNAEANARLIAAAPDLLAALEAAAPLLASYEQSNGDNNASRMLQAMYDAIRRARGEED